VTISCYCRKAILLVGDMEGESEHLLDAYLFVLIVRTQFASRLLGILCLFFGLLRVGDKNLLFLQESNLEYHKRHRRCKFTSSRSLFPAPPLQLSLSVYVFVVIVGTQFASRLLGVLCLVFF